MRLVREESVERWTLLCYERSRRPLANSALGSIPVADLLVILKRRTFHPANILAAVVVTEAILWAIG